MAREPHLMSSAHPVATPGSANGEWFSLAPQEESLDTVRACKARCDISLVGIEQSYSGE